MEGIKSSDEFVQVANIVCIKRHRLPFHRRTKRAAATPRRRCERGCRAVVAQSISIAGAPKPALMPSLSLFSSLFSSFSSHGPAENYKRLSSRAIHEYSPVPSLGSVNPARDVSVASKIPPLHVQAYRYSYSVLSCETARDVAAFVAVFFAGIRRLFLIRTATPYHSNSRIL